MTEPILGAACARHPERAALKPCARCGDYLCKQCEADGGLCAGCGDAQAAGTQTTLPEAWRGFQIFAWVLWVLGLLSYGSYWLTAFFMLNAGPVGDPDSETTMVGAMLAWVSAVFAAVAWALLHWLPAVLGRRGKVSRSFKGGLGALFAWGVSMWLVHSIGVYGLVLFFMDGNLWWMVGFMGPAMAISIWWMPRWKRWIAAAS